jgi:hypothetical protein
MQTFSKSKTGEALAFLQDLGSGFGEIERLSDSVGNQGNGVGSKEAFRVHPLVLVAPVFN